MVSSRDYIQFQVRKGVILPNRVTEDLVLTKENYYILPNAMTIAEGATVTAEAGTKIQFWCSDSEDVYTDSSIVYMDVKGDLSARDSRRTCGNISKRLDGGLRSADY